MTIKQNPYDLLRQASDIISERGENYGGIEDNFQLIADLASLRLGRDIHPYEIAVIMVCVKNARAFSTPTHMDSRIDAMNYEAFAATFAQDYLDQKTAAGTDIGYKKKTDLKPATVAKFNVPKSNVETLKPPKSATASSTATSSTAYSVNLDELSDEIIESK
jgi:hypothetical protein